MARAKEPPSVPPADVDAARVVELAVAQSFGGLLAADRRRIEAALHDSMPRPTCPGPTRAAPGRANPPRTPRGAAR